MWDRLNFKNMSWGRRLVLGAIVFMAFIITLSIKMMRSDVVFEEDNYYEKGESYQARIDASLGADSLLFAGIAATKEGVKSYSVYSKSGAIDSCRLVFSKADASTSDHTHWLQLAADSMSYEFPLRDFGKGKWKARIDWHDSTGVYHYTENSFAVE